MKTDDALCGFNHLHPVALLEVEIDGRRWTWPCAARYLLAERDRLREQIGRLSINPDHPLSEGLVTARMLDD